MASICYTNFKLPRVRVTKLSSCGAVVTGSSSQIVTDGIVSVAVTMAMEDREEFVKRNGNGDLCVVETTPPILKWLELELQFCNVDPAMVNLLTQNPTVSDDATSPNYTGNRVQTGTAGAVSFALEGWTRISGATNYCAEYGYLLWPWVVEGAIGDITYENDAVTFPVTARTRAGSLWGTGPYNIDLSDATATLNNPIKLLTAIGATDHQHSQLTRLAPPAAVCGFQAVP